MTPAGYAEDQPDALLLAETVLAALAGFICCANPKVWQKTLRTLKTDAGSGLEILQGRLSYIECLGWCRLYQITRLRPPVGERYFNRWLYWTFQARTRRAWPF